MARCEYKESYMSFSSIFPKNRKERNGTVVFPSNFSHYSYALVPHLHVSIYRERFLVSSSFQILSIYYYQIYLNVFRAHKKVTAPFKPVHICLMKNVDPVVCKLKKVGAPCPVTFCTDHVIK